MRVAVAAEQAFGPTALRTLYTELGVLLVAGTDEFFELKRSRSRQPSFD